MAAAPMPDPSQQPQGGPAPGAPSQAPASPGLMMLAQVQSALKQIAQNEPATSAGLAKAIAGVNEAMSSLVVSQPQPQAPSQSPPY